MEVFFIIPNSNIKIHTEDFWCLEPRSRAYPRFFFLSFNNSSCAKKMYILLACGPGSSVGIATDYGLDGPGSNPGGVRDFPPVQTGPGAHPAPCTMGSWSFTGVKSGRRVTLTPHRPLVPRSRKSRAIPLLPLWAVRSVQSFSACTRVHLPTNVHAVR